MHGNGLSTVSIRPCTVGNLAAGLIVFSSLSSGIVCPYSPPLQSPQLPESFAENVCSLQTEMSAKKLTSDNQEHLKKALKDNISLRALTRSVGHALHPHDLSVPCLLHCLV